MIRSKVIRKIAVGLALAGVFTLGAVNTSVNTVSAAEQNECTFDIESITGDYKTLNPTDYFLDCKNQGTVGVPITFTTNVTGHATYLGFTYSLSNRAIAKPADVYGPYAGDTFTWTPKYAGLYSVGVECKDIYGNSKYKNQYVEINNELKIESLTSDHAKTTGEEQAELKVGETLNLQAKVYGGYRPDGDKYTYTIMPRSASPDNRDETYYNLPSSNLAWTPKHSGIYGIQLKVKDELGNTAYKTLYVMVDPA